MQQSIGLKGNNIGKRTSSTGLPFSIIPTLVWGHGSKECARMPEELTYKDEAAAEYDRAFAHVTRYFMPFVLRAARVARGMRVLDIAAGTGLSAEAALSAVGPTGHVTAADVSPAMAEK